MGFMKVSIITTVKNEGEGLRSLLDSLKNQTRRPDEIVICDGGSSDNTLAILETYQEMIPLKILAAPGSNISQGRNLAIAEAEGPIIASTDGGNVLDSEWLSKLVRPIEEEGVPVVSGWFEPDPHTDFEVVLGATVLPSISDINPDSFLPSSRSIAFLKRSWALVGGYPEWLDYGEDLIFDLALRREYGPFSFVPDAVAYFRPRGNLHAFARQYYFYARGDGKANLWPRRHAIRYLIYLIGLPLIGGLIWRRRMFGWILLFLGTSSYCRRPIQRLWPRAKAWRPRRRARALALIPIIRLTGDLAKMAGYPVGLLWRWQQRRQKHCSR
jgi:glycosyltransferase involved in cell wall biosynthesis